MRSISTIKILPYRQELICSVLLNRADYGWRDDLASIQVQHSSEGDIIIEKLRNGIVARFVVTREEPPSAYEQTLTGTHVSRTWGFTLAEEDIGHTKIILTEQYIFKSRVLLFLSYLYFHPRAEQKIYLKKLQEKLKQMATMDVN